MTEPAPPPPASPPPVLILPVRASSPNDRARLQRGLTEIAAMHKALSVGATDDEGWTMIAADGEATLEAIVAELRAIYALEVELGAPQIAYRETITRHVVHENTFMGAVAPNTERAYARLKFSVEPLHHGSGFAFLNGMAADALSPDFAGAIEAGLNDALAKGPIMGFPVVDLRVLLIDADFHETRSSPDAFRRAARDGLREALKTAQPLVLEPVMSVTLTLPYRMSLHHRVIADEALLAQVAADLEARRGTSRVTTSGNTAIIEGEVPLVNMFGYAGELNRASGGQARIAMRFLRYAPVPRTPDDPGFRPAMALRPA